MHSEAVIERFAHTVGGCAHWRLDENLEAVDGRHAAYWDPVPPFVKLQPWECGKMT